MSKKWQPRTADDRPDPRYAVHTGAFIQANQRLFTCYLAMPDTPRGTYDEEIDIVYTGRGRPSMAAVRRECEAEIVWSYEADLKIKRVSIRW